MDGQWLQRGTAGVDLVGAWLSPRAGRRCRVVLGPQGDRSRVAHRSAGRSGRTRTAERVVRYDVPVRSGARPRRGARGVVRASALGLTPRTPRLRALPGAARALVVSRRSEGTA